MIQLFLSEPNWSDQGKDELVEKRKLLFNELESVLWSLMLSAGRSEVRLWLCNTIANLSSIRPRHQHDLFLNLLRVKPLKRHLAIQLLQFLFEKQPKRAGIIVAKKSFVLEKFFKGNPSRILQWFSNFVGAGGLEQRKGAKALSQFAFLNRDICWDELEWKGKHGQSPAMVASKPHYFLDLDVQRTVENFLEYVPEFWLSSEFSDSLKNGEILNIDTKFFIDMFLDLMYKEEVKEVWDAIEEFLVEESFSVLCHHLLIVLDEQDLSYFVDQISKFLKQGMEAVDFGKSFFWLEIILLKRIDYTTIDQLLLLNAVSSQSRQLLRLVREEGDEDEKEKISNIVSQICAYSSWSDSLALILERFSNTKSLLPIKWLGLNSWAIFFKLSEEFRTAQSWESLFLKNGIGFRKSDKYRLLDRNECSEESESEWDEELLGKVKNKKKGRHRRKRRRNLKLKEIYGDENDVPDSQSEAGDWLLSTDHYSSTWNIVDLPEHISKHCFTTWMK